MLFQIGRSFIASLLFLTTAVSLTSSTDAFAATPDCFANGQESPLPVMNEEVIRWKKESKNQFLARALVSGRVIRSLKLRRSHVHFEMSLGDTDQPLEVIYNREFGDLPKIQTGMTVEACGDYITSRAKAGNYPPSPSGAIIHWVHFNPGDRDGGKHEHGFVVIDGVLYGQKTPPKQHRFYWAPDFLGAPVFEAFTFSY